MRSWNDRVFRAAVNRGFSGRFLKVFVALGSLVGSGCGPDPREESYPVPFSTVGERLAVFDGTAHVPLFLKGVNLGVSIPGTHPGELAATPEQYDRWFAQMSAMGFNVVRVYTLHHPRFYEALARHNTAHRDDPLYVLHGVWLDEENPTHDLHALEADFDASVREVVDASFGRADIAERWGRASGRYTADISPWVIGWLLGREVLPREVLGTNDAHPSETSFEGEHFRMPNGSPTEVWWAERLDRLVRYERATYGTDRPVAVSSWLTLDPLAHATEDSGSSEDLVSVDMSRLQVVDAPGGFFASYHAYPYFPDFVNEEPAYQQSTDAMGPNSFLGYLQALKAHYAGIPLLVAEFGVPSSWGNAHPGQSGMHQGGHDEETQGRFLARMAKNIHATGYAGAVAFAWIDEWFKANWICEPQTYPRERYPLWHNVMNPEQSYGLIAFDPPPPDFARASPVVGAGRVLRIEAAVNAEFFFVRLQVQGGIGAGDVLTVGLDTYADDRGEVVLPDGQRTVRRNEFALKVRHEGPAQLHVTQAYDLYEMWRNRAGPEQLFRSVATDGAPWVPVRWRNRHERTWQDGTVVPPSDVATGELRLRRASQAASTLDAVVLDGESIEIRLPWMLLHFSDPSTLSVVDDDRATPAPESTRTDGIAVSVALGAELVETHRFTWQRWDVAPSTVEREKGSVEPFVQALRSLH